MHCLRNRKEFWRAEGKPQGLWPAAPSSRSIHHAHVLGALELANSLSCTHPIHKRIAMASTLPCSCSGATANSSPAFLQQRVHLHLGQPKTALNRQHGRRQLVTLAAKKVGTTQWSSCKGLELAGQPFHSTVSSHAVTAPIVDGAVKADKGFLIAVKCNRLIDQRQLQPCI